MHGVREIRRRGSGAGAHHVLHRLVARHEPFDVHRYRPHAAAGERIGREPGPKHDTVRQGIARRDTQREGIPIELERLRLRARSELAERGERRQPSGRAEEAAAIHDGRPLCRGAWLVGSVLQLVETVVDAALSKEIAVRSHLDHAALVKDDDPVHVLDR